MDQVAEFAIPTKCWLSRAERRACAQHTRGPQAPARQGIDAADARSLQAHQPGRRLLQRHGQPKGPSSTATQEPIATQAPAWWVRLSLHPRPPLATRLSAILAAPGAGKRTEQGCRTDMSQALHHAMPSRTPL